jgi:disulfide bond formation protein DsbB
MQGQGTFGATCSACHGLNARGIPGLGKDLVDSQFVHGLTDDALLQFIVTGRDASDPLNTTGIPMPPRGGNPSLTDDQLRAVIAYLRSESAGISAQAVPAEATAIAQVAPTATPAAPLAPPVLPTTIPVTPPTFTAQSAYLWSCAGCHGADGTGNQPFASGFTESDLLADRAALLAFLIAARPPTDPQVEFPHPARGGYPQLTDEQLEALTDYVISLQAP